MTTQARTGVVARDSRASPSFMAYHFHDLSPYVLVGNPLTLAIIECFAVRSALLGTVLYPLGLDAPVWHYVGFGITFILWVACFIAAAPGSTLHVRAFAPSALLFLSLAVMSAVLWRSWLFRASAIPPVILGLLGATDGPRYDAIVAPSGDLVAVRGAGGHLQIVGRRFNAFTAEQWLAADGDDRDPAAARDAHARCDSDACIAALPGGRLLSVVTRPAAFEEDGAHAAVIVTALAAPAGCQAQVFDRISLARTGAVIWNGNRLRIDAERSVLEDRPWSPATKSPAPDRVIPSALTASPGADPADP